MIFNNWGFSFHRCMPYHHHHCWGGNNIYAQIYQMGMMSRLMNMFMPQTPVFSAMYQPQMYNYQIPSNNFNYSVFNNPFNNLAFNNTPVINTPNWFDIFNRTYNDNSKLNSSQQSVSESAQTALETKKSYQTPSNAKTLGKPFLDKVKHVAANLNCNYKDLLALMNSESSLNPQAGKGSNYVGLVQFGKHAIQDLRTKGGYPNLTKEKIVNMSALEQLDLVEKLIQISKKYAKIPASQKLTSGDLYALILAPSRAGREVLYSKGEAGYNTINAKMDYNNDGKITKSELAQRVNKKQVDESIFA